MKTKLIILLLFICSISFGQLKNDVAMYAKCEETTGTTFRDETDNGNDLTVTDVTLGATGIQGKCGDYTASGDIASVTNGSGIVNGVGSVSFWINTDKYQGTYCYFTATGQQFNVFYSSATDMLIYVDGIGGGIGNARVYYTTSNYISLSTWTHIVVTFDSAGDDYKLYIDGSFITPDETNDQGTFTTLTTFNLSQVNASYYVDGRIDEVTIYNHEISQMFIDLLYADGDSRLYVYKNLINGKITYPEWIDYDLFCIYTNLKYTA